MVFPGERDIRRSADYYTDHPPRQPKREIADYVESRGILVPCRFANLDGAMSSGKPFIIRSEHKQDYQGASGLLKSYPITLEEIIKARNEYGQKVQKIDWQHFYKHSANVGVQNDARSQVLSQFGAVSQGEIEDNLKRLSGQEIKDYSSLVGIDPEKFFSEISYSYWEYLGGYNSTVVADNAIKGRYHIFTDYQDAVDHTIVEGGKTVVNFHTLNMPSYLIGKIPSLINFYEKVRGLEKFSSNQCPIIEIQTSEDKNYFLQYHRALESRFSLFNLNRKPSEDEKEAIFVRGATSEQGIVVDMNFYDYYRPEKLLFLQKEDAGFDIHYNAIFAELMTRKREIQFLAADNMQELSVMMLTGHLLKSQLFKAPISIAVSRSERDAWYKIQNPKVRVISDGRKAYVKLVE